MNNKVLVIAQKEAADYLRDTGFLVLLAAYTIIIFTATYMYGSFEIDEILRSINVKMISMFLPLVGIVLGFNSFIKERTSGSLNVLMTQPVYRDNIIAGKMLGSMIVLVAIIIFSVFVSVGTLISFFGFDFGSTEFVRLLLFIIITFLYASIFLGMATLGSILSKSSTDSLIYDVIIWLFVCVLFGSTIKTIVFLFTNQTLADSTLILQLLNISPIHHYSEAILGIADLGFGGINTEPVVGGIFDTKYTLSQCLSQFWMNIVVLIITPVILFITSFIVFLRRDITL